MHIIYYTLWKVLNDLKPNKPEKYVCYQLLSCKIYYNLIENNENKINN